MSDVLAKYAFLPWVRTGLVNQIKETPAANQSRAEISVNFSIKGVNQKTNTEGCENIEKKVQLYGPGDIIGIDKQAIVKVEPLDWITNFEPNYLPFIEFYDEDFPWRYTPDAASESKEQLTPWLTLIVLSAEAGESEGVYKEFIDHKDIHKKPLPTIEITSSFSNIFPKFDQLWAWAHVHVNEDITNASTPNTSASIEQLQNILTQNPDLASSRIICPRRLKANTAYYAFLIPSFMSGRLVGLGIDSAGVGALISAWSDHAGAGKLFPYYHRWYFRTGSVGDFEYLVRLLEAQPADARVGTRNMDVAHPGLRFTGIIDGELGNKLKLGGALRIPRSTLSTEQQEEVDKYENWEDPFYPSEFQEKLSGFVNLQDAYKQETASLANSGIEFVQNNPDPIITPPLYGKWHSLTPCLNPARTLDHDGTPSPDWVHDINLDPRHRSTAGMGTKVVVKNQERYMASAWKQVGEIIKANRLIRQAQLAISASQSLYLKDFIAEKPSWADQVLLGTPLHQRIRSGTSTIAYQIKQSTVPQALFSTTARNLLCAKSRLLRRSGFSESGQIKSEHGKLLESVNEGDVAVVQNKTAPIGGLIDNVLSMFPSGDSEEISKGMNRDFNTDFPNNLDNLGYFKLFDLEVSTLGKQPTDFDGYRQFPKAVNTNEKIDEDNFKKAMLDIDTVVNLSSPPPKKRRPKLDFKRLAGAVINSINPLETIPARINHRISIPDRIKDNNVEGFGEVMLYPQINEPMYKPLTDLSSEFFLPNINHIGQNSITILETNQEFIESYMLGLNHEFSRELLWREYPTDLRGTYFRQFWDAKSLLKDFGESVTPEQRREKLYDIPPLHQWPINSVLGTHDHRQSEEGDKSEIVLVIRGELLKKYPTAVIYAQKAEWARTDDGEIDLTKPRQLHPFDTDNLATVIKTPLYESKVEPDIYFLGFDLIVEQALGDSPDVSEPDAGWFFVIKERPGEPRFGLDLHDEKKELPDPLTQWNDLTWTHVGTAEELDTHPYINLQNTITLRGGDTTNSEDNAVKPWGINSSSADLAYILYQVPVMLAVHATEMLPDITQNEARDA